MKAVFSMALHYVPKYKNLRNLYTLKIVVS